MTSYDASCRLTTKLAENLSFIDTHYLSKFQVPTDGSNRYIWQFSIPKFLRKKVYDSSIHLWGKAHNFRSTYPVNSKFQLQVANELKVKVANRQGPTFPRFLTV